MIDVRFIQSMLARNKRSIREFEEAINHALFTRKPAWLKLIPLWKKQIAALAQIQVALKVEIYVQSNKDLCPRKKHGKNDPRYQVWLKSAVAASKKLEKQQKAAAWPFPSRYENPNNY